MTIPAEDVYFLLFFIVAQGIAIIWLAWQLHELENAKQESEVQDDREQ